ncbi:MAG: DUF4867 family protein [Oscillospiraceae bacterium]|nr:DUF4867 family protein [Oscillospiraceae bacterium]
MEKVLEILREKNPGLPLYSVTAPEFRRYGRILAGETGELTEALESCAIPDEGNCYHASEPVLEKVGLMKDMKRIVFGDLAIEAGYCNGHGFKLNAMEYHKCSEVNYTTTGLVLLLALPEQLDDGKLESSDVVGFYLPAGVLVEIFPMVLHFAPCRISDEGFRCLVILEKGTNEALESVNTSAAGEEKLLWMRNKWMTCHPDSPQREKGAYVGICGENLSLNI